MRNISHLFKHLNISLPNCDAMLYLLQSNQTIIEMICILWYCHRSCVSKIKTTCHHEPCLFLSWGRHFLHFFCLESPFLLLQHSFYSFNYWNMFKRFIIQVVSCQMELFHPSIGLDQQYSGLTLVWGFFCCVSCCQPFATELWNLQFCLPWKHNALLLRASKASLSAQWISWEIRPGSVHCEAARDLGNAHVCLW